MSLCRLSSDDTHLVYLTSTHYWPLSTDATSTTVVPRSTRPLEKWRRYETHHEGTLAPRWSSCMVVCGPFGDAVGETDRRDALAQLESEACAVMASATGGHRASWKPKSSKASMSIITTGIGARAMLAVFAPMFSTASRRRAALHHICHTRDAVAKP